MSNQDQVKATFHLKWAIGLVLFALFSSGVASVINQSIWQRAIKVYLAGSESISSMIVVFVFMFGLGVGALAMGRYMHLVKNPLRSLAHVELLLCAINLLIIGLLSFDITTGAMHLQSIAHAIGIPLGLLYMLVSACILLAPCFLMGTTMPLVSAACQEQLKCSNNSFLNILFILNTVGAAAGSLASGLLLLPLLGQQNALLFACLFNTIAGILAYFLSRHFSEPIQRQDIHPINWLAKPRKEEVLSFWLGFLGLAFEMYLFRFAVVNFTPLPYTFSTMLCFYLVLWSVGMAIAKVWTSPFNAAAAFTAFLFISVSAISYSHIHLPHAMFYYFLYALPCIGSGLLFGLVVRCVGQSWGQDIGRFYGYNTIGSCLGIFIGVLVCYNFHYYFFNLLIVIGYIALWMYYGITLKSLDALSAQQQAWSAKRILRLGAAALFIFVLTSYSKTMRICNDWESTYYFGSQGVVLVDEDGSMKWDGLWHSKLSNGRSHIDTRNWHLSTIPICCHKPADNMETLVIGLGTGITAATLARFEKVKHVDVYEINPKLDQLLSDFPIGTLHVGSDPKVNIQWRDARIGLALSDKKYDIITQQPLYLKQAGSSILLSKEYMELIKSHLKEDGIFCIYSNSMGNAEQNMVVRKTAATVFPHVKSFINSYMILVSKSPFEYSQESIETLFASISDQDIVKKEMLSAPLPMWRHLDSPKPWDASPIIVTDDQPIVEYPGLARWLVLRYQEQLARESKQ